MQSIQVRSHVILSLAFVHPENDTNKKHVAFNEVLIPPRLDNFSQYRAQGAVLKPKDGLQLLIKQLLTMLSATNHAQEWDA